jgi:hypothetical protein
MRNMKTPIMKISRATGLNSYGMVEDFAGELSGADIEALLEGREVLTATGIYNRIDALYD